MANDSVDLIRFMAVVSLSHVTLFHLLNYQTFGFPNHMLIPHLIFAKV